MRRRVFALGAVVSMLAACAVPAQPPQPTAAAPAAMPAGAGSASVTSNRITVEGAVRVPSALVAAGGMNLVAAGSGNLVAAGSMNLVAAGGMNLVAAGSGNLVAAGSMNLVAAGGMNYGLLAVDDQPLAGVAVFLCDGLGRPIPGLPAVVTDDAGHYAIPHVPAGFTLVVNALLPFQDGKRALMTALVRSGRPDAVAVDAASTLTAIRAASIRQDGQLGEFEAALFNSAVGDVRNALTRETLPDYRDVAAVGQRAADLEGRVDGLAGKLTTLRTSLGKGPGSAGAPVGPGATPLPMPSATDDRALDGPCSEPRRHTVKVQDLTRGGTAIVIRSRVQGEADRKKWPIRATSELVNGVSSPIDHPEGCAHRVELLDRFGQIIISDDAWIIAPGSADEVALPF